MFLMKVSFRANRLLDFPEVFSRKTIEKHEPSERRLRSISNL